MLVAERDLAEGQHAAEALLPAIAALLAGAAARAADLEAFAVSVGPGSFTGLRVAVATVKGLAFASAHPVAPVPTLAALARGAGVDPVVAVLDARRGELYAAGHRARGEAPLREVPEGVYTPAELAGRVPPGCAVVGEADERAAGVELAVVRPAARHVGELGAILLARGAGVSAEALVPSYVRRADAEVKRTGLRFEEA